MPPTAGTGLKGSERAAAGSGGCETVNRTTGDQQMQGLTFNDFSQINRRRCEAPDGFNHPLASWSLSDWITAVVGELGEAANVAKKLNRVRDGIPGNKETPEELREKFKGEICDAFIYLDLLAQSQGFQIGHEVLATFNAKSHQIGYVQK